MLWQPLRLLDVEHGVRTRERYLPLNVIPSVVGLALGELGCTDHGRAVFALPHVAAEHAGLLVGHPDWA